MNKLIFKAALGWLLAAQSLGMVLAKSAPGPAADAMPQVAAVDHCSWNRPGVDPFMGDVVAAVDRYRDISPEVRTRLKERMARREYDDLVSIRRDAITGRGGYEYGKDIHEMHFGANQVCRTVTRDAWTPQMEERGLVYCESGTCILVPTVCRNVSRIARRGVGNDVAEGLPPFLPPGAGYPGGDDAVLPALPLADALPLGGFAVPGAGFPLEGGPIGDAPGVGWGGPVLPAGVVGAAGAGTGGGTLAAGGGGGSGGVAAIGGSPLTFAAGGGASPNVWTSVHSSLGSEGGGASSVPLAPVPEPETWAMLIGGLFALGFLQRRAAGRRSAQR